MTANERERRDPAAEPTTVLPETAAQLVELERLQQALSESEERAKSHWEQYLRAFADLDNVRKRAQRDIESANRYGLEKIAQELLPVRDSLELAVQNATARTCSTSWPGRRRRSRSWPGRSRSSACG